ncbi:alpha-galactosidase [Kordiimonas sp. SCSIO 12610]|uniref:alpha-galactosidase n=1 Tax=Kordiimonas sp. SCSIO 12610 TaxID=2829597 RepID=UPI00210E1F98|nr:alpha-galactosidase [Kordiimonas sp. SCSIO 12610]UTW54781.1 alpha-galactosidase [Kordiimonas sp. SCSIO 12610]
MAIKVTEDYVRFDAGDTSLILACAIGERPRIVYLGGRLFASHPAEIDLIHTRQHAHGSADVEIAPSILNELGAGVVAKAGFLVHRNGDEWYSFFSVTAIECLSEEEVVITCLDHHTNIEVKHTISMMVDNEVITFQTSVQNVGRSMLNLQSCMAACVPIGPQFDQTIGFSGRWAGEFKLQHIPKFIGSYVRENKKGRTSHDAFPAIILGTAEADENSGQALGFHLGWSGNSHIEVERLSDGRAFVHMGEYLFPGEVLLGAEEIYQTPILYVGYSGDGFNGLSHKFHNALKSKVLDDRKQNKPRPIHYNTWEAVYFDHSPQKLMELAQRAADVGAERFVLDDGWFGGRRNDQTGLGDWWIAAEVYPEGLKPLIDHVNALGMEFGIWFEPEMVNPDSELYRKHPDWILSAGDLEQVPFRNQYALDLTRSDVCDYLFGCIDDLLSHHNISYIKWDMNRDVHHPGHAAGRAVTSKQTKALYSLLERIRNAHPDIEIESCSSGGGRADYGILNHSDRIWTSDSNDALDRQHIQRGASYFFPLSIMGAHVGPEVCHITGRKLSMELRVATAFLGHMGMEMNLLDETPENLKILKLGISLHKQYRRLIHQGDFYRLDTPDFVNAVCVVSKDKEQALLSWCNMTGHSETLPPRIFFTGLKPDKLYRLRIIWPVGLQSITSPSIIDVMDLAGMGELVMGEALMKIGVQAPLLHPETCIIYHVQLDD